MARRYCDAVRARGYQPTLRDLYRMRFDPCLQSGELPRPGGFGPAADVKVERDTIGDAGVFVFIHPLWFYDRPAMMKGYIDRVFGMGFGYGPVAGGRNQPLLAGRKMLSFTSSGSPLAWLQDEGTWTPILTLLDSHVSRVCGLSVLDHVHFGEVTPSISDTAVGGYLDSIDETVARLFPQAAEVAAGDVGMTAGLRPASPGTSWRSITRLAGGAVCVLLGGLLVGWLTVLLYRGSARDEATLVALGIPVLMLLTWWGLALLLGGLVWIFARRR